MMSRDPYKPKGYKVKPMGRAKLRSDAHVVSDALRRELDINTPLFPIVDAIEFMDAHDIFDMDLIPSGQMPDVAAQLISFPGSIPTLEINEQIYDGACDGDCFSRFTLAHELGHYFLHSNQPIPLQRATGVSNHKAYLDSEWQANTFAGELLVDSRIVAASRLSALEIEDLFGVSNQTANIQWRELHKEGLV